MIQEKVDFFTKEGEKLLETWEIQDVTVHAGAFCPIKAHKFFKSENRHYNINSFQQIAWPDPFLKPTPSGKYMEGYKIPKDDLYKYRQNMKKLNLKEDVKSNLFASKNVNIRRRIQFLQDEELSDEFGEEEEVV